MTTRNLQPWISTISAESWSVRFTHWTAFRWRCLSPHILDELAKKVVDELAKKLARHARYSTMSELHRYSKLLKRIEFDPREPASTTVLLRARGRWCGPDRRQIGDDALRRRPLSRYGEAKRQTCAKCGGTRCCGRRRRIAIFGGPQEPRSQLLPC
jgi:hypothetical protein